jgi:tRNA-splicing ligase RtcB
MLKVIFDKDKQKIPIKMWLDTIEESAMNQLLNLSNLPFAFHHIAEMPDGHCGYGMPIGGVLATEGVAIPNAVGVDIGCGMCTIQTSLKVEQLDKETLKKVMGRIREIIPVGKEHHKEKQDESLMPNFGNTPKGEESFVYPIVWQQYESALTQIGTLGGGNHFIEIQKDKDNFVWVMIHSGSRNLGYKVAKHYNDLAIKMNQKWFSQVPKEWELAFLPIETQEAKDYMTEMQYCVDFALANRKLMMERIIDTFDMMGICPFIKETREKQLLGCKTIWEEKLINIAHNYATWENHFGKNVIIHRKGATLAREETRGIIPGSQGTKSYIVKGKGNKDSFESCSHGAGRLMSRTKAQATLNLEDEIRKMDEKGIIHGIRNKNNLDEAAGAYKNIDEVMENQKDLVEILVELEPLAVIKGD